MKGSIRRRGTNSYQLRYYAGVDPTSGKEIRHETTFKGSRKQAQVEMARLVAAGADGTAVAPASLTLSAFLDRWDADWASANLSPKSLERYRELLRHHVRPALGALPLQKLTPLQCQKHYADLMRKPRTVTRNGAAMTLPPLQARTVGHVHRVVRRALGHAVTWRLLVLNPVGDLKPPRVEERELEIIRADLLPDVLAKLAGQPLYPFVVLALASGCRRGELAALRWQDIDWSANADGKLRIARSLEQTRGGLRFKPTKTRAGRRTVAIAASAVAAIRAHRRTLAEQRLALGLGALGPDDLVFPTIDGGPRLPNSITTEWRKACARLKLRVSLHALRHTHASICIARGMDVVTLSRRLGHASPAITLKVYAHLFDAADDRAASIMETIFNQVETR